MIVQLMSFLDHLSQQTISMDAPNEVMEKYICYSLASSVPHSIPLDVDFSSKRPYD